MENGKATLGKQILGFLPETEGTITKDQKLHS